MYRLAFIAIESGACVANPIYETEEECMEQLKSALSSQGPRQVLASDVFDRRYSIPTRMDRFVVVIEPVEEDQ